MPVFTYSLIFNAERQTFNKRRFIEKYGSPYGPTIHILLFRNDTDDVWLLNEQLVVLDTTIFQGNIWHGDKDLGV